MNNKDKIRKIVKEKDRLMKLKEQLIGPIRFEDDIKVKNHIIDAFLSLHQAEEILRREELG